VKDWHTVRVKPVEYDLVVIGGGPAGMMGAATAARQGCKVVLLEKNDRLGKKLAITGGGRCNFTNLNEGESFFGNIVSNGKFLYSALNTFASSDLIAFFYNLGVQAKVEQDGKVFPASGKSTDIIQALRRNLTDSGVEVRYDVVVLQLQEENKQVTGVLLPGGTTIKSRGVLVATGGASYQQTGSKGDGYRLAGRLGHSIIPPQPALVPLVVREGWVHALQGVALENVVLSVKSGGKVRQSGEMLFTHFGLSGPAVLNLSSYLTKSFSFPLELSIDLRPELAEDELIVLMRQKIKQNPARSLKNTLNGFYPLRLVPVILVQAGVDGSKQGAQVSRWELERLVKVQKNLTLSVSATRPLNEAMVTSGGISTKEINPSTLESKMIKGLFFAGEVIDVDALTGGYNLQIAFSTGYLSGLSAGKLLVQCNKGITQGIKYNVTIKKT
jgi:predicted Rossmann fold flavoprotein